jgi:hypothetical protein
MRPSLRTRLDDFPSVYRNTSCVITDESFYKLADGCVIGTNKRAPIVALWGDSHAAQWYPALEPLLKRGIIRVQMLGKGTCPVADVLSKQVDVSSPNPVLTSSKSYPACDRWRRSVLARLAQSPPAILITANWVDGYMRAYVKDWEHALIRTLRRVPAQTHIIVMADTPVLSQDPATCLAKHLVDTSVCDGVRSKAISAVAVRQNRAAAAAVGARYLDFTEYLCNRNICPVIIGNTLIYLDYLHLTASSAKAFAPLFETAISETLSSAK